MITYVTDVETQTPVPIADVLNARVIEDRYTYECSVWAVVRPDGSYAHLADSDSEIKILDAAARLDADDHVALVREAITAFVTASQLAAHRLSPHAQVAAVRAAMTAAKLDGRGYVFLADLTAALEG
ncbi:MAG TPA: hypothetical protein VK631_14535 [Solirubrobacteraceae bacterium]|nr:hypothetical protein [Solirubrobacteraceae bacterium]